MFSLKDRKRRLAPTRLRATATPTTTSAAPAPATTGSTVQVAASLATLPPAAREAELVRLQSLRGNYFVTSVLAQMPEAGVEDPDQTSIGSTPTESISGDKELSPAEQARLAELEAQLAEVVAQIESIEHTLETIRDPAQRGAYQEQLAALQQQAAALEQEIASLTELQQRIYAQVVSGSKA